MNENEKSIPTKRPKVKYSTNYYKNMSTEDFNMFCKRFVTFHTTGVYLPPPEKPVACQNKNRKKGSPRSYIPEDKEKSTTFGKGRVGVSCESYGVKNCFCCQPENSTAYRILNLQQSRRRVEQSDMYEARIQNIFDKRKNNTKTAGNKVLPVRKEQLSDSVDELVDEFDRELQEMLLDSFNPNDPITLENENLDQIMSDTVITIDDSINDPSFHNTAIILSSDSESDDNNENFQYDIPIPKKICQASASTNLNSSVCEKSKFLLKKLQDAIKNEEEFMEKKSQKNSVGKRGAKSQDSSEKENGDAAGLSLTCPVCFEILKNKEVMSTTCGHLFCALCITNCIKINKCCPVCRKALNLKRIHPIYL